MKLYITIVSQIKQEQGNTLDFVVKGSRNIKIWKTQYLVRLMHEHIKSDSEQYFYNKI